jgi:hypothetical protein
VLVLVLLLQQTAAESMLETMSAPMHSDGS